MAKFIELHLLSTGNPVLVNLDRLEDVRTDMNGRTILAFSLEDYDVVKENYEEVKKLIWEEKRMDTVAALPAADVVEVVRCKDCDLWNEWDNEGHEQTGNYVCSCAYFSNDDGYDVYTGPDDYCSHGGRKKG